MSKKKRQKRKLKALKRAEQAKKQDFQKPVEEKEKPAIKIKKKGKEKEKAKSGLTSRQAKKQVPKSIKKKRTSPAQYVNEVKLELKRVSWPSRHEVLIATIIVVIMVIFFGLLTGSLDFSFGKLVLYMTDLVK